MEDTVYTKIIRRELPAEILYEDDKVIVILNLFPNIPGETLVITKEQEPYVFNLSEETYTHLMKVTKDIAKALDRTFLTLRTCMVLEGFNVPHVHVRLYPVTEGHLNLSSGPQATPEHLAQIGAKIRPNISLS
jgi:histidine triad (HIT) family protein